MPAPPPTTRRHHPLAVALYALSGLALLLAFLPVWDVLSPYRVAIVVGVTAVFLVTQTLDWRRMRTARRERRRRWGLGGRPPAGR